MGKKNKKKGMKMPARVENKHVSAQQSPVITHTCTHWSNKRNRCKLGTVCSDESVCRAHHL